MGRLFPVCPRNLVKSLRDLLALWMVSDENHGRFIGGVVVRIVVGLDTSADGLQDQRMVFSWDRDVSFGAQYGLAQSDLGNCAFERLGVLDIGCRKKKRLPARVMAMEMFMSVFAMVMGVEAAVGMAIKLGLVVNGFIQSLRHLVQRAMVMMMAMLMGWRSGFVMEMQAHAQTCVELRVIGEFHEPNFGRACADRFFRFEEIVL